ncbi:MAG TPA: hypothetical protein VGL97_11550 [Bryobacteraceae bacterium]
MNRTLSHRELPDEPDLLANDERWELVQRIVSSRQFRKAPQLREILIYICQRGLADPAAVIKEHEIGCTVLGRKPDFNPYDDNIVRVQISHLRKKLEEYFTSDGKDEAVQIRIPRGAYVPRFEPKAHSPLSTEIVPPVPPDSVSKLAEPEKSRRLPFLALAASLTAILAIAGLYFALRRPGSRIVPPATSHREAPDPFWSRLFGNGQSTGIVISDSSLVMLQDILHSDISVDEYSRREYASDLLRRASDAGLRSALELIGNRQYTSLADTNIAYEIERISQHFVEAQSAIHYARNLNIRDFKTENFILIGSRRGIPWVELFEPQLNFALEEDHATHRFYFRNRNPEPGEAAAYIPTEDAGAIETYADIALLPNLGNSGSVLILSGITMEGSEAAGDLVTSSGFAKELERLLGPQGVKDRYFEILLKTRAIAGATRNSQIVTYRLVQPVDGN